MKNKMWEFNLFNQGDGNYTYDPMRTLGLQEFHDPASETAVSAGILTQESSTKIYNWLSSNRNRRLLHFDAEQPNRFISMPSRSALELLSCFGSLSCAPLHDVATQITVFSICPYTVDFAKSLNSGPSYVKSFWPTNDLDIDKIPWGSRDFDVVYTGGIFPFVKNELDSIRKKSDVRTAIVSSSPYNFVTHRNTSYREKMAVIENSKITLVHNQLHFSRADFTLDPYNLSGLSGHKLFEDLAREFSDEDSRIIAAERSFLGKFRNSKQLKNYILPQLKTRLFEAAFRGSLILCKGDSWNLANQWFKEGESMVVYKENELLPTIKNILDNQDYFEIIANNAREIAKANYSARNWYDLLASYV